MLDGTLFGKVCGFTGEYEFLSNFYPCSIEYEGLSYTSTEHAYQAAKTLNLEDRLQISLVDSPGKAKQMGKRVELRPDWEQIKDKVMFDLVLQKFNALDLREKLLATDNKYLEETNWWNDRYWGVCKGTGKNMLGVILMNVRAYYAVT